MDNLENHSSHQGSRGSEGGRNRPSSNPHPNQNPKRHHTQNLQSQRIHRSQKHAGRNLRSLQQNPNQRGATPTNIQPNPPLAPSSPHHTHHKKNLTKQHLTIQTNRPTNKKVKPEKQQSDHYDGW